VNDKILVTIVSAVLGVCHTVETRVALPAPTADTLLTLTAVLVLALSTWRVKTGRIPPLELGPGRKFQHWMLAAGAALVTVAIFWLMISYLAESAWFPGRGYALVFFPFVGMFMIGTMCVLYPAILWFYRLIGLAQFSDKAATQPAE